VRQLRQQFFKVHAASNDINASQCGTGSSILMKSITLSSPPEPIVEHAIRLRAYELYEQRARLAGHDWDDWLQAEGEMLGETLRPNDH
jgi:hypothetical protein